MNEWKELELKAKQFNITRTERLQKRLKQERKQRIRQAIYIILGYIIFALFIVGICELRDWNINNQCNNGNVSMCNINN